MNTRIGLSIMSILVTSMMLAGSTFALFTDQATSTNNTFAAGNADLQIALDTGSGPGTFGDTIAGPNFSGIAPGETKQFEFWLKNNSSSAIDLDLTSDVSTISPPLDITQEIDNALLVSWVCDTSGNGGLEETPTAEFSPRAWLDGGNASLGSLIPAEQMICRMFGRLPSDTSNDVAGESVSFDVVYDATQAP